MSEPAESNKEHSRSSRQRYQGFVQDYKNRTLDDWEDGDGQKSRNDSSKAEQKKPTPESKRERKAKRYAVGALFAFALVAAGLEMVEPLFMRFIVDHVLLNTKLDTASRLSQL